MTTIPDLIDRLELANVAYHKGIPILTDVDFDLLEDELRRLDQGSPLDGRP